MKRTRQSCIVTAPQRPVEHIFDVSYNASDGGLKCRDFPPILLITYPVSPGMIDLGRVYKQLLPNLAFGLYETYHSSI